jgi:hypothetical protein
LALGCQPTKLTGKGDVMAGLSPMLDARPDLAEVHVNCALAQLGLGKYRDAESSLRLALVQGRTDKLAE